MDSLPPFLLGGCFAAISDVGGCYATFLLLWRMLCRRVLLSGGWFATAWKASSVMVYPLCRFSSRVAGWVAKLVVASLFMLLLLYVSLVAVRWVCSPFSVFLCRLSLVLLGRSSPVWRLQELFVNCFLLNEIRAKAHSRKKGLTTVDDRNY